MQSVEGKERKEGTGKKEREEGLKCDLYGGAYDWVMQRSYPEGEKKKSRSDRSVLKRYETRRKG